MYERKTLQELRKQFQIISELRTEVKSLQSDNLKLYEKVRYMQSYREEAGSRPPTSQLDPLPAPEGRLDDITKYQTRYEEAMNPFEAFRGRVNPCVASSSPLHLSICLGGYESIQQSEPRRERSADPHAVYSRESTRTDFLHHLCFDVARLDHVYDLRVLIFVCHAGAEATKSILETMPLATIYGLVMCELFMICNG